MPSRFWNSFYMQEAVCTRFIRRRNRGKIVRAPNFLQLHRWYYALRFSGGVILLFACELARGADARILGWLTGLHADEHRQNAKALSSHQLLCASLFRKAEFNTLVLEIYCFTPFFVLNIQNLQKIICKNGYMQLFWHFLWM